MAVQPKAAKSLQAAFWNCNGLRRHRYELANFVNRHDLDVVMLSETRLNDNHRDPILVGYSIYRTDRPNGVGGGTAIFVRKSIRHHVAPIGGLQSLEATGVLISTTRGPLHLVSVYNAPNNALNTDDLELVFNSSPRLLIAGDLNAKSAEWDCRSPNTNGRILSQFAAVHDLHISAPSEPTHICLQHNNSDILDIAVSKNLIHPIRVTALDELSSDHSPVLLHIGTEANEPVSFATKSTNWPKYALKLHESFGTPEPVESINQIDEAVMAFENKIKTAKNSATKVSINQYQRRFLPRHISDLIREKNRARRRVRRWFAQEDKRELNRLKVLVRDALFAYENEKWQERVEELSPDEKSLWKMAKTLRSERTPMPPIHSQLRGVAYTDDDKAEAFADSAELQCTPNVRPEYNDEHIDGVRDSVLASLRTDDGSVIEPTTEEEIRDLLSDLKIKKSPGPDEITNRELKLLPANAILALMAIINAILLLRYFPTRWKSANIIFLPKPAKDKKSPENYRPISLLCSLGKIVERVIHKRLSKFIGDSGLIPDEQFGFRREHSTTHQLHRVTEFVTTSLTWKYYTGIVFLDVAKAFDTVWHEGLLYKLISAGVPISMVQLLKSFISERSFRAKINSSFSTSRPLAAGVPQGSVLSPLLFNIFTADIPKSAGTTLAIYADDTAILARSNSAHLVTQYLQRTLHVLEEWLHLWRIVVNPEKSKAMLITRRKTGPSGQLLLFGAQIPWQDEVKYLGVIFDKKLQFHSHVKYLALKAKRLRGYLSPLTGRRSLMSLDNKLLLYKTIIRPSMTYASVAWGHCSFSTLQALQVIQNQFLRGAFNAPWFVRNEQLHREAGLITIHEFMHEIASKYFANIPDHSNHLVREAADYDENLVTPIRRPKSVLLLNPEELAARVFPRRV